MDARSPRRSHGTRLSFTAPRRTLELAADLWWRGHPLACTRRGHQREGLVGWTGVRGKPAVAQAVVVTAAFVWSLKTRRIGRNERTHFPRSRSRKVRPPMNGLLLFPYC